MGLPKADQSLVFQPGELPKPDPSSFFQPGVLRFWDRMDEAQQQHMLDTNEKHKAFYAERKKKRVAHAAKVAEDMRKANWIDPDMKVFRTRLWKMLDENGNRLPSNDLASIETHKAMVQQFISRWGIDPIQSKFHDWKLIYSSIRKRVESIQRQVEAEARWKREAEDREALKAASHERQQQEAEANLEREAEQECRNAETDIERYETYLDIAEDQIEVIQRQVAGDEARIKQLQYVLDKYGSFRRRSLYERLLTRTKQRLAGRQERLARYENKVDSLEDQIESLQTFLNQYEAVG